MDLDLTGRVLGERFELLSPLGEGGYGAVYLARQITMDREVAVKVIHPRLADTDDFVERFEREARLASRLQHPNTVVYFDFGRDGDVHFLAMELVKGATLSHEIGEHGALAPARAAHLASQICGSLSEAHDQGMVHRDLKPGNILLTRRGGDPDFIKVIDFGLAKIVQGAAEQSGTELTAEGVLLGTPAYMSPEQIRGHDVDHRCDIYALGVILFVMLTGRKPYDGDTPLGTAVMHLTEPIPLVREHNPALPADFERLVWRCMAKEPADRPPHVEGLQTELRAFAGFRANRPSSGAPRGSLCERTATMDSSPSPEWGRRLQQRLTGPDGEPSWEGLSSVGEREVPGSRSPAVNRSLLLALLAALVLAASVALAVLLPHRDAAPRQEGEVASAVRHGGAMPPLDSGETESEHPGRNGSGVNAVERASELPESEHDTEMREAAAQARLGLQLALLASQQQTLDERERRVAEAARRQSEMAPQAPVAAEALDQPGVERRRPSFGRLRISAVPYARVTCDGRALGRTPIEERVEVGTYECRIISPQGREIVREIDVEAGDGEVVRIRFD